MHTHTHSCTHVHAHVRARARMLIVSSTFINSRTLINSFKTHRCPAGLVLWKWSFLILQLTKIYKNYNSLLLDNEDELGEALIEAFASISAEIPGTECTDEIEPELNLSATILL